MDEHATPVASYKRVERGKVALRQNVGTCRICLIVVKPKSTQRKASSATAAYVTYNLPEQLLFMARMF